MPAVSSDIMLDRKTSDLSPVLQGNIFVTHGAKSIKLETYSKILNISRVAIYNDDMQTIAQVFRNIGTGVGRIEAKLIAEKLVENPLLSDNNPAFAPEFENDITGTLPNDFYRAVALLRTQKTPAGQLAGYSARHLIICPELESTAREMLFTANIKNLECNVLTDLPADHWYLTADPLLCPTIALVRLANSKNPLSLTYRQPQWHTDNALSVMITADIAVALLRRNGIVRCKL